MKEKQRAGGEREAAKGRSVENYTSAHVSLTLRDDRRLTAEIKTTPLSRLSRSSHIFQSPSCLFCFLLSFPRSSSPPQWSFFLPSRSSTQRPCPGHLCLCVHDQGVGLQSDHPLKTRCIGGKLSETLPHHVSLNAAQAHRPELDSFLSV